MLVAWAVRRCSRTLPGVGTVVLPVAAVASLLPALFDDRRTGSRTPASRWAAAHVAVALVAYALFIVAALQALVLMGLEKRLHRRLPDPDGDGDCRRC